MQTQLRIVLREVESLNSEQVQILAIASGFVSGGQFGGQAKVSMPKLKTLDSALLAQTLLQCSSDCGGVVTISPEAATALAGVPNREAINPSGTVRVLPPYGLSFPCLQELNPATDKLSPETATALANLPGTLDMPLEILDSVPLAEKYARQSGRTLDGLEAISAAAIPAYVKSNGFFHAQESRCSRFARAGNAAYSGFIRLGDALTSKHHACGGGSSGQRSPCDLSGPHRAR